VKHWSKTIPPQAERKREKSNMGSSNGASILTEKDVLTIRKIQGQKHRVIAELYGVHRATITSIMRRVTWKHI
jgi:hypothetical protein